MKRPYKVCITEIVVHEYEIDEAVSPEQAEDIALQWLEDGEEGNILSTDIDTTDVVPDEEDEEN